MLNTVLMVRQANANSHQKHGWEEFTAAAIRALAAQPRPIVFMLWGKPAQTSAKCVDKKKHCVLETVHPSPLSAHRGFLGCKHFSKANAFLVSKGLSPIDWSVV